ncbi:MAG: SRPBCC family protein [Rhodobacterales bacterium]|nr:SRPBCC family protein [Rhodobacterales bacterium]
MKLSTREDIEAPIAFVFDQIADFDAWERSALRRGAEVQRTDSLPQPGAGMTWRLRFPWRGKARKADLALAGHEPPHRLAVTGEEANLGGRLDIELIEMSPRRTRMTVAIELKPRTLTARLFLQSLKLAKARLVKKLKARTAQFAAEVERRHDSTRDRPAARDQARR